MCALCEFEVVIYPNIYHFDIALNLVDFLQSQKGKSVAIDSYSGSKVQYF